MRKILGRKARMAMTTALLAFALASTLLILAPGPDSLLVMRNTLRNGPRAGWVTASGTTSGLLVWAVAAALGLSALLRVSHLGYNILRFAGAGYLIWLGLSSIGLFRRKHAGTGTGTTSGEPADPRPGAARWKRAYLNGLLSNLFNPKIGVFFIAFLPGFIPAGASTAMFSLALGLWFMAETGAWLAALTWMVAHGVGWLRRSTVQRRLERVTGLALIGFGLRLASETGRWR
jgi:threonine/homoserine/homoserine lactone efflux protein